MRKCHDCNHSVSLSAYACPNCGNTRLHEQWKAWDDGAESRDREREYNAKKNEEEQKKKKEREKEEEKEEIQANREGWKSRFDKARANEEGITSPSKYYFKQWLNGVGDFFRDMDGDTFLGCAFFSLIILVIIGVIGIIIWALTY